MAETGGAAAEDVKAAVREQFGRTAAAYAASPLHARGADLDRLVELLAFEGTERVLDVGTATGHTALRVAPRVAGVIGVDMTPAMLAMARTLAAERGVENVVFQEGDAEQLPFADESFDVVTCRVCAHHFPHVRQAVSEMARVVRRGGRVALVDNYAPEERDLDTFINTLETVRDPTHVREYTLSEWRGFFARAGLAIIAQDLGDMLIQVAEWVARAQTPAEGVVAVHGLLTAAPDPVRAAFGIEGPSATTEGSFRLKRVILVGRRPALG